MAVSMTKWVDITSGSLPAGASDRELILRLITTSSGLNNQIAVDTVYECESAADVLGLFGSESNEYKIAAKYFAFVSLSATKPTKISFWRPSPAGAASTQCYIQVCENRMTRDQFVSTGVGGTEESITVADWTTLKACLDAYGLCTGATSTLAKYNTKYIVISRFADVGYMNAMKFTSAAAVSTWNTGTRSKMTDAAWYDIKIALDDDGKYSGDNKYYLEEGESLWDGYVWVRKFDTKAEKDAWAAGTAYYQSVGAWELIAAKLTENGGPYSAAYEDYDSTKTYAVDAKVKNTVNGTTTYYVCKTAIDEPEEFTSSKWMAVSGVTYADYSESTAYNVGNTVKRTASGVTTYYVCKTNTTAGSFDESKWVDVKWITYYGPDSDGIYWVFSEYAPAEDYVTSLTKMNDTSDNFATFFSVDKLSDETHTAIAAWNATLNYKYRYCVPVQLSSIAVQTGPTTWKQITGKDGSTDGTGSAVAYLAQFKKSCCTVVLDDAFANYGTTTYPQWLTCALLASTKYSRTNSTIIQEFKALNSSDMIVTCKCDSLYNILTKLNVNFYGQTQKAGQLIAFYMEGYNIDGVDTSVCDNEIWLKDRITTEVFNRFVKCNKVPAGTVGNAIIKAAINGVIAEGLNNLAVQPEKTISDSDKAAIIQNTGASDAPSAIYSQGYYLSVSDGENETVGAATRRVVDYILYYSTGEGIRKVTGSHVMV